MIKKNLEITNLIAEQLKINGPFQKICDYRTEGLSWGSILNEASSLLEYFVFITYVSFSYKIPYISAVMSIHPLLHYFSTLY